MSATEMFTALGVCCVWIAGIGAAVYLTMNGHPIVGVILAVIAFCIRVRTGEDA